MNMTTKHSLQCDKDTDHPQGRLLIFIVAYNAENTIESVLNRIPSRLQKLYDIEVLIIDDSSADDTFRRSELVRRAGSLPFKLKVLYNPVNQGYGGNQKIGFHYAIEQNFDWVALVHGDGQYAPERLPRLVEVLAQDEADVVFGSRMLEKRSALKGGMPLYKYVGNKVLTTYQNAMLGTSLSEFHSGYRLYSVNALKSIPFHLNSNDFHFDTEIIIQLVFAEQRIAELPIPTFYGDEICHVNGIKYAWNVFRATLLAKIQPVHVFYDPKYDCRDTTQVNEGLIPVDMYLKALETEGLKDHSSILLVGNVPERLKDHLRQEGHAVSVKSSNYFRKYIDSNQRFDYIYLLEDSGMSDKPEELVRTLAEISKFTPNLKIGVTVANIGFALIRLQLLFGRFAYTRKGIINLNSYHFFTQRSLKKIFTQNGFTVSSIKGLPVPYSKLIGSTPVHNTLTSLHNILIKLRKSLFSFQFIAFVSPPTSLDHLLTSAIEISSRKSKEIGKRQLEKTK